MATSINANEQKLYRIVTITDAYHSRLYYPAGAQVLKAEGPNPTKWVHDDNYGAGYPLEKALEIVDGYAWELTESNCNLHYEDDESIADFITARLEDDEELSRDDVESELSWYSKPGFYSGHELVYEMGNGFLEDDVRSFKVEEI